MDEDIEAQIDSLAERIELAEITNRVLREKLEGISNRLGSFQLEMDKDKLG